MRAGDEQRQRLSVVVPAYDEERRLPALLAALEAEADAGCRARRGCARRGDRRRRRLRRSHGRAARLVRRRCPAASGRCAWASHLGKGAAVKAGLLDATGDVALVTDVDLSAPLGDLAVLAGALRAGADSCSARGRCQGRGSSSRQSAGPTASRSSVQPTCCGRSRGCRTGTPSAASSCCRARTGAPGRRAAARRGVRVRRRAVRARAGRGPRGRRGAGHMGERPGDARRQRAARCAWALDLLRHRLVEPPVRRRS